MPGSFIGYGKIFKLPYIRPILSSFLDQVLTEDQRAWPDLYLTSRGPIKLNQKEPSPMPPLSEDSPGWTSPAMPSEPIKFSFRPPDAKCGGCRYYMPEPEASKAVPEPVGACCYEPPAVHFVDPARIMNTVPQVQECRVGCQRWEAGA